MSYTLAVPDQVGPLTNLYMLALAIYREARGTDQNSMRAVGWVIRNRTERKGWFGTDYYTVVTKPYQFSSFNRDDRNAIVFGGPTEPAWREAMQAAVDVIQSNFPDPTNGATFYYDRSMDNDPPPWAKDYFHTADIGPFHFFKQT